MLGCVWADRVQTDRRGKQAAGLQEQVTGPNVFDGSIMQVILMGDHLEMVVVSPASYRGYGSRLLAIVSTFL